MKYFVFASILICMLGVITVAQQQQDQSTFTISVLGEVDGAGVYRVRADRPFFLVDALALGRGRTASYQGRHQTWNQGWRCDSRASSERQVTDGRQTLR